MASPGPGENGSQVCPFWALVGTFRFYLLQFHGSTSLLGRKEMRSSERQRDLSKVTQQVRGQRFIPTFYSSFVLSVFLTFSFLSLSSLISPSVLLSLSFPSPLPPLSVCLCFSQRVLGLGAWTPGLGVGE